MANAGNITATLQLKVDDFRRGIQDASKQLSTFSNTTKTVAKGAGLAFAAIGTALGGVAVAAGALAMQQEELHAKMQAATGATKKEMEQFGDVADNLFKNGRGNYEEIYTTLTSVKQQMGLTGKEAEKAADGALILSKSFGWDMTESIRAASQAQKAFGVDATTAFDTFAGVAQVAGDKADDLLDTFWEYSPTLAEVGWSMDEMASAMKAGAEAGGYNFDVMADSMKEFKVFTSEGGEETRLWAEKLLGSKQAADDFFTGVQNGSITNSQAMQMITQGMGGLTSEADKAAAGAAFFGTKWEDVGIDVLLAMGAGAGAVTDFNGKTAEAGNALDSTLGHKIEVIKNSFLLWAKELGEKLMPSLKAIADWVIENMPAIQAKMDEVFSAIGTAVGKAVDVFKEIYGFIKDNKTELQALAIIIAAVVVPSMLGFILQATVMKTKALAGLLISTAKMIAANYALGLSFLAANLPLLLIIAGIAALIAIGYLIVTHWDEISAFFVAIWGYIKDFLVATWDAIVAVAAVVWQGLVTFFTTLFTGIATFFSTIWEGVKAAVEAVWNGIVAAAKFIFEALKAYFTFVFNVYKTVFMTIWNAIKAAVEFVWNGLKATAMSVFNALVSFFTTVLNGWKTIFTTVWNAIKTTVTTIWNGIKSVATSVWNGIKSSITSIINGIKSVISSVFNGIKTTVTNIFNGIKSTVTSVWNGIKTTVSSGANYLKDKMVGAVNAVKDAFKGMWNSIKGSLEKVVDGIKEKAAAGKEFLQALNPFKRNSPSLVDNVKAGTKVIKDTYKGLADIRITPPQIGSLSAGNISVEEAFATDGGSGGNGGSTYNAPIVQVENMNVRSDNDVRQVSKELFSLQQSSNRAKGGR